VQGYNFWGRYNCIKPGKTLKYRRGKSALAFSQNLTKNVRGTVNDTVPSYKFSVSTTYFTFINSLPKSVYMYEFHFGYKFTPKNRIEIKVATWSLFEPMGIPMWDSLLQKESELYPGRIRESGIGIAYQRFLWKGLFASVEILPLLKKYTDDNGKKLGNGFKLYTSYHIGYHVPLFKDRLFLEPQIHCNYWPIDTKGPQGFEENEQKWSNRYFLFEPNLFIGVNF
jgi:hypothetical protein